MWLAETAYGRVAQMRIMTVSPHLSTHSLTSSQVKQRALKGQSFWIRATIYSNNFPQEEFNHYKGNEVI